MSEKTKLERFLSNLEKLDHDPGRAIAKLSEIENIEEKIRVAKHELGQVNGQLAEGRRQLSALQTEIHQAGTRRASLVAENFKAATELAATQEQVRVNLHRIEFAESIQLLFSDLERIPVTSLMELCAMLRTIWEARLNPAAIYPIDYESTRKKAVELLELALGKSLVPRELFDGMIKRLGEKQDDLMLDNVIKMEKERAQLTQLRATLENATGDKLIRTAIYEKFRGRLTREYYCPKCRVLFVHSITDNSQSITKCVFCNTNQ